MDGDETLVGDEGVASPPAAVAREPARGDLIGRFVVLERRGDGSMGVVYAAYDPELDRKVAIKLLHPRRQVGRNPADERHRLLREAQAIARVNHPHVIAIHDVGEHEGGVFLAMEYVDGPTLTQWLAERPRTIAEILTKFIAAGQGLAAAHAKDLVHRDFKPDNVMLDDEGRVRVLDFGLVRTAASEDAASTSMTGRDDALQPTTDALATAAGREGAIVGTPAYMAPEQLAGTSVDARADQFSFCVTLYEAVYGQRPFVGCDLIALAAAITAGEVHSPAGNDAASPKSNRPPKWLRRVLLRGLSASREQRWPDMHALVDALALDRTRARRFRIVASATTLTIAAAAALVWQLGDAPRERCAEASREGGLWDADRRIALEQTILASDNEFRRDTWHRLVVLLDARAQSLQVATMSACVAAPTDPLAAARHLCVARHRRELDATIAALLEADIDAMVAAIQAVSAVPDAVECNDATALGEDLVPPSPAIAEQVQRARDDLAQATALHRLAHFEAGLTIAGAVLATARDLAYRPLVAEAAFRVASLELALGRYPEAEADAREAFAIFVEVGDSRGALRCAQLLTYLVGDETARPDEGLVWADVARALLHRGDWVGEEVALRESVAGIYERRGDTRLALTEIEAALALAASAGLEPEGSQLRALGEQYRALGDFEAAQRAIEEAIAIDTARLGPDHPQTAGHIGSLASVHLGRGDHAVALEHYHRSVAILERALGPEHERVAVVLSNIATTLGRRGDYDTAIRYYERSLAISARNLGPDHPDTLVTAANIATVQHMRGDAAEARARFLELLPRAERQLGADHPQIAELLGNLASTESTLGREDDAITHLQRALVIVEATRGADHADVASLLFTLGDAYTGVGRAGEALPLHERALAIYERVRGRDHVDLSWPLLGIGAASRVMGDHVRATAAFERAVALRDAADISLRERAEARFGLARALWVDVDQRPRARALARQALVEAATDGPELHDAIEVWLREHAHSSR